MAWATRRVNELGIGSGTTLEVGSWDVNGSVRPLFTGDYWGVDIHHGPGVDELVTVGGPLPGDGYDVVVCTEVLEHDEKPWRTIAEMVRVLKTGGHLLVTARGYDERGCYELHNLPIDYWRFSPDALRFMAEDAGLYLIEVERDPEFPGAFLTAVKPGP